jgi:hypothetical protein
MEGGQKDREGMSSGNRKTKRTVKDPGKPVDLYVSSKAWEGILVTAYTER